MITKIQTPDDFIQALNENLEGLITGKRKIPVVKEATNIFGKMMDRYKLEAVSKGLANDRTPISWFENKGKIVEIPCSSTRGIPKFSKQKKAK